MQSSFVPLMLSFLAIAPPSPGAAPGKVNLKAAYETNGSGPSTVEVVRLRCDGGACLLAVATVEGCTIHGARIIPRIWFATTADGLEVRRRGAAIEVVATDPDGSIEHMYTFAETQTDTKGVRRFAKEFTGRAHYIDFTGTRIEWSLKRIAAVESSKAIGCPTKVYHGDAAPQQERP